MFTDSIWETEEHVFYKCRGKHSLRIKVENKSKCLGKIRKVSNLAYCQLTLLQLQVQEYS